MDNYENHCPHLNEIIDQCGGAVICTDCGLVLSEVYLSPVKNFKTLYNFKNDYILEILSRLQMPEFFKDDILKNLDDIEPKYRKNENAMAFVIFKTLNDLNCGVSIKDVSSVTGYTDSQIYNFQTDESIFLNPITQLEKYCAILELPKNSFSVIKENMKITQTGHNPNTVLGTAIYKHCKEKNLNISMQKIARTLNISCVSIQRYIRLTKNES